MSSVSPDTSLGVTVEANQVLLTRVQTDALKSAHERWGHRNFKDVAELLGLPAPRQPPFCRVCIEAKMARRPSARGALSPWTPAPRPGYRLYMDIIGPFRTRTVHGEHFAMLLMDCFSRLVSVALLARVADWFPALSAFVLRIEAEKGSQRVVSELVTDSFPAFTRGGQLAAFSAAKGIQHVASPPYSQNLNPLERSIRTAKEGAMAMVAHAGASRKYVGYALQYYTIIANRLPRKQAAGKKAVPLEKWLGHDLPDLRKYLLTWGCAVYTQVNKDVRGAFGLRAAKGVFLGIASGTMSYIVASLPAGTISHHAFKRTKPDLDDFPWRGTQRPSLAPADMLVDDWKSRTVPPVAFDPVLPDRLEPAASLHDRSVPAARLPDRFVPAFATTGVAHSSQPV